MDNRIYDVIIIGGGPSGLFAGTFLEEQDVLILEKNSTAGEKLLLSGSGQCNFTNNMETASFIKHYNKKENFIKAALKSFTNKDLMEFLEKRGLPSVIREDGKVFPKSMDASDFLHLLLTLNKANGNCIYHNCSVSKIEFKDTVFTVETDLKTCRSRKIIIATGGKSYPQTGSDGSGLILAQKLGHTITETHPSLAPVFSKKNSLAELSGISFKNAAVHLYRDNKKFGTYSGELLITHRGLSGPVIINNSRDMRDGDMLKISFTGHSYEEINAKFMTAKNTNGKQSIRKFLQSTGLPERMASFFIQERAIDEKITLAQLGKGERSSLLHEISEYFFLIDNVGGYQVAMATTGGVSTSEVNRSTMESKICPGLYFAGEILDVDGDTGGFNIQWAASSAVCAARAIKKS